MASVGEDRRTKQQRKRILKMKTETPQQIKHTPGEWKAHGCTVYQVDDWKDGNNLGGRQIARAYPDPVEFPDECPSEEDAANANLIAAAPGLLVALKMAREAVEALRQGSTMGMEACNAEDTLMIVDCAIAKASGEPCPSTSAK
jgi:hypothetical protein